MFDKKGVEYLEYTLTDIFWQILLAEFIRIWNKQKVLDA